MTREEFCKFLITVKEGSKLKYLTRDVVLAFDGVSEFNAYTSGASYQYSIGYVFSNLTQFEIIRIPRKKVFEFLYDVDFHGVFDKDDIFEFIDSLTARSIKISERNNTRITIEEIL